VSGGVTVAELATLVSGEVRGDPARRVRGVESLESAGPDDLSFLTNARYRASVAASKAGVVLVGPDVELPGRELLVAPEPYVAFARILAHLHPEPPVAPGISPSASVAATARLGKDVAVAPFAVVEEDAVLGDGVAIGAGSYVGARAVVGEGSVIHPRVVLYAGTVVGARCTLHAGTVLGGDGFGFATAKDGVHHKIPQRGRVVLEDDVEIGANTTIDRGTLGETRIGTGTKIDNLVMVGHGVSVGGGSLLVAQSGIAGSTRLGRHVTLAGQSGVAGHLRLGDRVVAAAKSAVFSDVEAGRVVGGIPAIDLATWKRVQAAQRGLPGLRAELRALRARIEAIERERGKA
jgi:UDP-3-O-[3-hydroxymyristoyl] glucosamine N-acyltransferase